MSMASLIRCGLLIISLLTQRLGAIHVQVYVFSLTWFMIFTYYSLESRIPQMCE